MSKELEALDLAQRAEIGLGVAPDAEAVLKRARAYLAFLDGTEDAKAQQATHPAPSSGAFRG